MTCLSPQVSRQFFFFFISVHSSGHFLFSLTGKTEKVCLFFLKEVSDTNVDPFHSE